MSQGPLFSMRFFQFSICLRSSNIFFYHSKKHHAFHYWENNAYVNTALTILILLQIRVFITSAIFFLQFLWQNTDATGLPSNQVFILWASFCMILQNAEAVRYELKFAIAPKLDRRLGSKDAGGLVSSIAKHDHNCNPASRDFESSRDLTIRYHGA